MDRAQSDAGGVDLLVAVRRHAGLFLVPVVVVTLVCLAYGLARHPVYTAQTRLSVGRLDIATQGIAGFSQAEVAISSALSRAVIAPGVVGPAAKRVGMSVGEAADALGASPVAGAPIIVVEAKTHDRAKSIALANAGANGLVTYTKTLGTTGGNIAALAKEYSAAQRDVARLTIARDALRKRFGRSPTRANRLALQGAEGKLAQRTLERNSLGNVYSLQATGLTAANLLGVLAPAYRASSDRLKVLGALGATGLIAGLVIGLALVGWREATDRRRRVAAVPSTA